MKNIALLTAAIVFFFSLAQAQSLSKVEIFGGYSYEGIDSGIGKPDLDGSGVTRTSRDNNFNLNGFNIAGTDYFTKHFGLTADFSAHFNGRKDSFDSLHVNSKMSLYNITAGPQYKFSSFGRFTPFAHALFGVAHRSLTEEIADGGSANIGVENVVDRGTSFSMNLGGGVDYKLNDRFALRLFQIDYNPIFLRDRTVDYLAIPGRTLNGTRFSAGIVFK
jgi:opacity protein-like surface antigen